MRKKINKIALLLALVVSINTLGSIITYTEPQKDYINEVAPLDDKGAPTTTDNARTEFSFQEILH